MTTFKTKLSYLIDDAIAKMRILLYAKGVESEQSNNQCLMISDEKFMYDLDGDRYLTEITENALIDNHGYSYGFFGVLDTEQFLSLIDYLIEKYK